MQFDYNINNSNNKKSYDRIKSYIILFTLVVGIPFIINICASAMVINLSKLKKKIQKVTIHQTKVNALIQIEDIENHLQI